MRFKKQPENINMGSLGGDDSSTLSWDDLRVATTSTRRGDANKPTFKQLLDDGSSSVGVYGDFFDADGREDTFFTCQMPHGFAQSTTLKPHIHWVSEGTDTGDVVFTFEWTYADIGDVFPATTISDVTVTAPGTALQHTMTHFDDVTPDSSGVSGMFICRVSRDAANAADTCTDEVCILEFDFHYQFNRPGSREESTQ
jgi:hypothetical protein